MLASSRATSSRLSATTRWRTLQVSCASVTTSDSNWLLDSIALIGGQHFVLTQPTLLTIQDLTLFPPTWADLTPVGSSAHLVSARLCLPAGGCPCRVGSGL